MWELACRGTDTGFVCELPPGEYVIGDPDTMLFQGVLETTKHLISGAYDRIDDPAIFVVHEYSQENNFTIYIDGEYCKLFTEGGRIAIMSSDIVKPLPDIDHLRFNCDKRAVVEFDNPCFTLKCETFIVYAEPEEDFELSDEQMYSIAYQAVGY